MSKPKLDVKNVADAVALYNRFRSPEANTRLLGFDGKELALQFEGPFCSTCSFYDYLEDLAYELKQLVAVDLKIENVEEKAFQMFVIRYSVK
jgi:hypothetical protein